MWRRRAAERMATSAKKERTERMVAVAEDMMMITFLIKKLRKKRDELMSLELVHWSFGV